MALKKIIRNKKQYAEALEDLANYKKARNKILNAQSYTIGAEQINRASLAKVEDSISALETAIDEYERHGRTGRRAGRIVPVD